MDLYPSAVSQARPGAGEALCPREEQCQCHAVSAMELELAVIPSCPGGVKRCDGFGLAHGKRLSSSFLVRSFTVLKGKPCGLLSTSFVAENPKVFLSSWPCCAEGEHLSLDLDLSSAKK